MTIDTRPVYLDYNGTTPLDPAVLAAMEPFLTREFGNPSSSHWYGIVPAQAVKTARRQVAELLHCLPKEIIFTSGGTESNNHAIKGMAAAKAGQGRHIISCQIEHPAVLEVCAFLDGHGFSITYLPVDEKGRVSVAEVAAAITPETIVITIMHANNEVGTIQPLAEIAALARERGIVFHTDAAQSVGKIPTDVQALGVDMLSLAGHKLYAPKGVGVLYIRDGLVPDIFCHGAGQESGRRAGTENVAGIAGLGAACHLARQHLAQNKTSMQSTRDRLAQGLIDALPGVTINGTLQQGLPNTLSIAFPGIAADRLLEEIGLEVAASAGAACHSDTVSISHVLTAMGLPEDRAKGTLRFSTGRMTTMEEIDRTIDIVTQAVKKLRGDA